MTVSTVVNHEQYDGNGTTTVFPYRFRILKASHMVVTVSDPAGTLTTLTLGTDYLLTGVGLVSGGNVVLNTPIASGWQISLDRDLPAVQETDLRNQGKFFAETHEDAFDYLTMLIQRAMSSFGLALRKPSWIAKYYDALTNRISNLGDPKSADDAANKRYVDGQIGHTLRVPEPINELPPVEQRRNKMPAFDDQGRAIVVVPPSGSASDVLLELAKPSGSNLIGYQHGYAADVPIPLKRLMDDRISVTQFGVFPDGTDVTVKLCAALDAANGDYMKFVQYGDQRKSLYIPPGVYKVDMTKLTGLHQKVGRFIIRCDLDCVGTIPDGDFIVLHAKSIRVSGLSCKSCHFRGFMYITVERLRSTDTVKLSGDLSTPDPAIMNWGGGSSWSTFIDTHIGSTSGGGSLFLSPDNSFITHNTFIQTSCAGLSIGAGTYECHANTFINLDTSGAQFNPLSNISTPNQCNLVIGWYDEVTGTGKIVGNWNVIGGRVNQRNWQTLGLMNSALMIDGGDTAQAGGDFISFSPKNMCEGADWGIIGGDGIPSGLTKIGTAGFYVGVDATEPSGSGRFYGSANTSGGGSDTYFNYALGISKSGRVRGAVFINGVPDQILIGNNDGTNILYQDTSKYTQLTGAWRLYRISGNVDPTKDCRCTILSKAGNQGLYVGGAFFTPYNVCPLPQFPGWNKTKGISSVTPTYISGVPTGFIWYRTSTSTPADQLFAWIKRSDGTLGRMNCAN